MKFKSQFYGLIKKIKNGRNSCFIFSEIIKLTINIYSNLSNKNIQNFLKFPIPILHRQFSRIICQNREYLKIYCNDLNNPFHLACRKWYLHNQSL